MSDKHLPDRPKIVEETQGHIDDLGKMADITLTRHQDNFGELVARVITPSLPYSYLREDFEQASLGPRDIYFAIEYIIHECRDIVDLLESSGLFITEHHYYQIRANPIFPEHNAYIAYMERTSHRLLHGAVETFDRMIESDTRQAKTIFRPRLSNVQNELLQALNGRINTIAAIVSEKEFMIERMKEILDTDNPYQ